MTLDVPPPLETRPRFPADLDDVRVAEDLLFLQQKQENPATVTGMRAIDAQGRELYRRGTCVECRPLSRLGGIPEE